MADEQQVALSAQAAEAEIAAASAHARRAAALLAEQSSQTEASQGEGAAADADDRATSSVDNAIGAAGMDGDDWEARRARQIAVEQDEVATGTWRDDSASGSAGYSGYTDEATVTGPDTGWQADAG